MHLAEGMMRFGVVAGTRCYRRIPLSPFPPLALRLVLNDPSLPALPPPPPSVLLQRTPWHSPRSFPPIAVLTTCARGRTLIEIAPQVDYDRSTTVANTILFGRATQR